MDNSTWIPYRERKPTRADADKSGCVLAWHIFQGVMLRGWENEHGADFFTHWMRCPPPPPGAREALEEYNRGMLAQYGAGCLTPEEEKDNA